MKRRAYNLCLLLLVVLFSGSSINATTPMLELAKVKAKKEEFTKQINKDFPITSDGTINLINRYGDVDIKTWNQNKVSIKITIKVKAKDKEAAQEVFDRIDFDFSNSEDYVKAENIIESSRNKSWWGWSNSKTEFKINYEVKMPKGGALDVYNKYGDVFAAEVDGRAKVGVDYGNLRMDGVNNSLEVNLGYSNGTIYKCRDVDAYVKYGKLKFKAAEDMNIESKYSKVYIDEAKKVKAYSKYDTYEIGKIEILRSEGKYDNYRIESARTVEFSSRYSDLHLDKLSEKANVDIEYGSFEVEEMSKGFSEINLEGKYADFKINLHDDAAFSMDMAGSYAELSYPSGMEINYEKEKSNEHEVKGYKGSKSGGGKIYARLKYGGVRLR